MNDTETSTELIDPVLKTVIHLGKPLKKPTHKEKLSKGYAYSNAGQTETI